MPFSIELFLDPEADSLVRRTWDAVDRAGHRGSARPASLRPHVTLGVWDRLDLSLAQPIVRGFVSKAAAIELCFPSVGTFVGTGVVYFAPVVTRQLLELHAQVFDSMASAAGGAWAHYQPNQWTPHCTIVERAEPENVAQIVTLARQAPLPFVARAAAMGIVQNPGAILLAIESDSH